SRFHMPLWLISGDASRNNALDLQAEGPWGKWVKDDAAWFCRHVRNVLLRVLEAAVESGHLAPCYLDETDVVVTPQRTTEQRNPMLETNRNQTLFQNGLMGKPTWSVREGLDFEKEQEDLRAHGGPPPGAGPKQPAGPADTAPEEPAPAAGPAAIPGG